MILHCTVIECDSSLSAHTVTVCMNQIEQPLREIQYCAMMIKIERANGTSSFKDSIDRRDLLTITIENLTMNFNLLMV
jgi:hypothetical protein